MNYFISFVLFEQNLILLEPQHFVVDMLLYFHQHWFNWLLYYFEVTGPSKLLLHRVLSISYLQLRTFTIYSQILCFLKDTGAER